jgi:integration host factor subunit alpha
MTAAKKLPSLTKMEISEQLVSELSIQLNQAKDLVDVFFEELKDSLESGREVHLSGFGNFTLRDKTPRPGRNPKTGQEVTVSERRVVSFKVGTKLKGRM